MRTVAATLLLVLVTCVTASAQAGEEVSIELKSGETVSGVIKNLDEDGVTVVGADKIGLFMRWGLVRGDKHYELRKRATRMDKLDSLLRLIDFCHDFALDTEQGELLKSAETLAPGNTEIARRRARLTGQPDPGPGPIKPPDPTPTPPQPTGKLRLKLVFEKEDKMAFDYMTEKLTALGCAPTAQVDFTHQLKISLTLTVTKHVTFFDADLYAVADGKLDYTLTDKSGTIVKSGVFDAKDVRSEAKDARAGALKLAREQVMDRTMHALEPTLALLKK